MGRSAVEVEALIAENARLRSQALTAENHLSQLKKLIAHSFGLWSEVTESAHFTDASTAFYEMLGIPKSKLIGEHISAFVTGSHVRDFQVMFRECVRSGSPISSEVCLSDCKGLKRNFEWTSIVIFDASNTPRVLSCGREVTDRVLASTRFRDLFDGAPDALVAVDQGGVIELFNRQAEILFGRPSGEVLGRGVEILVPEADRPAHSRAMKGFIAAGRGGRIGGGRRLHGLRSDGSEVPVEITLSVISPEHEGLAVAAIRDVTESVRQSEEREAFELQIRHSQKLEALGVLAGGVAHDFNNLLAGIVNYANLAIARLEPGAAVSVTRAVREIKDTALRMASLTDQMLAYAGRGRSALQLVDLGAEVTGIRALLSASVSKKAVVQEELDPELPLVLSDPGQIRQVLMNLITNASDALGDVGGLIKIRTGVLPEDPADLLAGVVLHGEIPGKAVFLEVSDNGCGMDADTSARMFDPFFTTKQEGRGLGMAAVRGIVQRHGGAIGVASHPDVGTRCLVVIPSSDEAEEQPRFAEPRSAQPLKGLRIMVVDDEECVRDPVQALFESLGASVASCADGYAALRRFLASPDEIDAVILDLTMPHPSGREVLREIRKKRGDLAVILSSGYSVNDLEADIRDDCRAAFVGKPYDINQLVERILALRA